MAVRSSRHPLSISLIVDRFFVSRNDIAAGQERRAVRQGYLGCDLLRMRPTLILFFTCASALIRAQVPTTEWLRTAGGFDQYTPNLSAIDPTGGIYTCAYGEDDRYFGSGITVSDTGFTIARYDPSGAIQWARTLTTSSGTSAYVHSIATRSDGELWVTGYFISPTLTIDGFVLNNSSISAFLARFDATGAAQFATAWGDPFGNTHARDVCTDALDRVFVTGHTNAPSLTFGSITVNNTAGGDQMWALYLDSSGTPQWAVVSEAINGGAEGLCIATNGTGEAFVATRFNTSFTIGTESVSSGATAPAALVKLGQDGQAEWMHLIASCDPLDLTVDMNGNTYLCGDFQYEADFDGTVLTPSVLDGFVASYGLFGDFRWVTAVHGDIDNELCWSVEVDAAQTSLIVGGTFVISASFGGTVISTGTSPTDGFVMHMDTAGTVNWVKDMTGDGPTLFAEARMDAQDHIYAAGTTQSQTTYVQEPVENASGNQAFLVRFGDLNTSSPSMQSEHGVSVYPNPSTGSFTVALPTGTRMVVIEDALGRVQQQFTPISRRASFTIEQPGVYLVVVVGTQGREVSRVVVR